MCTFLACLCTEQRWFCQGLEQIGLLFLTHPINGSCQDNKPLNKRKQIGVPFLCPSRLSGLFWTHRIVTYKQAKGMFFRNILFHLHGYVTSLASLKPENWGSKDIFLSLLPQFCRAPSKSDSFSWPSSVLM